MLLIDVVPFTPQLPKRSCMHSPRPSVDLVYTPCFYHADAAIYCKWISDQFPWCARFVFMSYAAPCTPVCVPNASIPTAGGGIFDATAVRILGSV